MDSTVQVALIGIITTLVTTAGVVVVAILNNHKERGQSAESAMEKTLRERIILRDEQIEDLRQEIQELKEAQEALRQELDEREGFIMQLQKAISDEY